ncbi:hypothetical protein Tco_0391726, partial [Tanacetum coccineum]
MIEEEKVDGIVMMKYEEVVEEEVLMAYEDVIGIDTQWYLDTAARNHMHSDKGLFSVMKEAVDGDVSFVEAKLEWCSQNNQNVMVNRVVKVKKEGGNEKVHEE